MLVALALAFASADPSQGPLQSTPAAWSSSAEGLSAQHPSQSWDLGLAGTGLRVQFLTNDGSTQPITVAIGTSSFGREGDLATISPDRAEPAVRGERVEIDHGAITEWFVTRRIGIEHGWTIVSRPAGTSEAVWIGLRLQGDLDLRLADDGLGGYLVDRQGAPRMIYGWVRAWDADGKSLDARLAPSPRGVGVRVVDRGARYPITVDPLLYRDWEFQTDQANASGNCSCIDNGLRTKSAGDVNGDGFSDIVVTSALFDGPAGADEGRVWVFHGSSIGPSLTPSWTANGTIAGGRFGINGSGVGDVNGDGYDDLLVSARLHGNGKIYVWHGGPGGLGADGTPANADFTWESTVGACTWMLESAAGDLNGDGFDDFAVGCTAAQRVAVFFGGPTGIDTGLVNNPWLDGGTPTQAGSLFGSRVAGAGDLDADGYADLAVSAPNFNNGTGQDGRVFFYLGRPDFRTNPPTAQNRAGSGGERFGVGLASAGDSNGDGYADLAIGAPGWNGGTGKVYLFEGGLVGLAGSAAASRQGPGGVTAYGEHVAPAGDIDADGFGDIVISAFLFGGNQGALYDLHGAPALGLVAGVGDNQYVGGAAAVQLGHDLGGAGDVNGDGFSDIVASLAPFYSDGQTSEGAVRLFFGRPQAPFLERRAPYTGESGSETGRSLAFLGDLNGDGFSDWAVGKPGFDGAGTDRGRVNVYYGKRGAPPGSAGLPPGEASTGVITGTQDGGRLGTSVSGGDIDNDGFVDLVVGQPGWSNGQAGEGRVLVFRGSASGISTTPAWTFEPNEVNGEVGRSVAANGDVNKDGRSDVLVGGRVLGGVDQGSVRVFLGTGAALPSELLPATPNWSRTGDVPGITTFATSLAYAGDVDRDGYSDFLIGSPDVSNSHTNEGRAYLHLGGPFGPASTTAAWFEESNENGARFGTSVGSAGDLNGDGYSDIFVTAPEFDAARGRVTIFHGATAAAMVPAWQVPGALPGDRFGLSAAGGGDINGDGFGDFVVGLAQVPASSNGAVHAFLWSSHPAGPPFGLPTTPSETYLGTGSDPVGAAVAIDGDVNGDGLADLLTSGGVLLDGIANIFIAGGGTASSARTMQRRQDDASAVAMLGLSESVTGFTIRGDAYNQEGVPGTAAGREVVRIQHEVKPLGALLNGSGLVASSAVDTGPLSSGAPPIAVQVVGLNPLSSYRWRQRFLVRNLYVPRSRWLTFPGNTRQESKLGLGVDCNANGVPDAVDIGLGTSFDCNGNLLADECEVAPIAPPETALPDCNNNLEPDECELVLNDCNSNLVPDECDPDCNTNGQPDDCDIAQTISQDTNGDGVPDDCQPVPSVFCPGDGTGTGCPCGNASSSGSGEGCLNSLGLGGRLRASGVARIAFDNFVLSGTQMPNSSALYFQGTAQAGGGNGTVFGDGLRCAAGSVIRLGTKINSGGASQYPVLGDLPISVKGAIPPAGGTRSYQVWYRNAASFCSAFTFNLTNGIQVTWVP